MNLIENISQAFSSLWANKMRALLTMLGIIIGIGSVIAILTVGDALTGSVSESMSGLGANNVTLSLQSKKEAGRSNNMAAMMGMSTGGAIDEKHLITDEMLDALGDAFPDTLKAVSISDSVGSGQTTAGRLYANLSLTGVNPEYAEANSLTVARGRFLNGRDNEGAKKVAVVSDKLVANMFGKADPLGQQITVAVGDHVGSTPSLASMNTRPAA
ncbi:ABC transporter permease [Ruminococcaceae bacterium OttesenSCG-928-A11]|nr:ABC transporter permease [Ruminococcaceae bacterium OttesenSCG-928-A11]